MMNKEERRQAWIARITAYQQSGQTMKVWCGEQGVTLDQLKYWLRKLKAESARALAHAPTSFVPLVVRESNDLPASASLRLHIGAVRIEVNSGFDPKLLREVITALASPC